MSYQDVEEIPAFNHLHGLELPYTTITAVIRNVKFGNTWKEEFRVSSIENAEKEIKIIINVFNSTLKYGESPREFISISQLD
jgi:hypothetical protein